MFPEQLDGPEVTQRAGMLGVREAVHERRCQGTAQHPRGGVELEALIGAHGSRDQRGRVLRDHPGRRCGDRERRDRHQAGQT